MKIEFDSNLYMLKAHFDKAPENAASKIYGFVKDRRGYDIHWAEVDPAAGYEELSFSTDWGLVGICPEHGLNVWVNPHRETLLDGTTEPKLNESQWMEFIGPLRWLKDACESLEIDASFLRAA